MSLLKRVLWRILTPLEVLFHSLKRKVFLLLPKLLLHARELQANKTVDSSHIHFDATTKEEKKQFSSDLNVYLNLLKLSWIGNLDICWEHLRHALQLLGNLQEVHLQIDAGQYAGTCILIRQAILCILHYKSRCSKKIFCKGKMLLDVVKVVNTRILGKPKHPVN
jgi:hypothetical protein